MPEEFLTTRQAATYLKISRATLERLRREGRGPRFVRLSTRLVRYPVAELQEWLQAGGEKQAHEHVETDRTDHS